MAFEDVVLPDVSETSIGVLGGTGPQGRGLAFRLAQAGHRVTIGSRDHDRAVEAAGRIARLPGTEAGQVTGADNATACEHPIVIIAVPWDGHAQLLESLRERLAGRVVVDCVNPLGFDAHGPYALPVDEGSAAQQAESLLPDSRVTAAFHHVSGVLLNDPELRELEGDVMVLGDDREAAAMVQGLVGRIPRLRGVWAGRLRNAGQVESLTANVIAMNRRYKANSGVRVTGL